jgi:hypothetical protein
VSACGAITVTFLPCRDTVLGTRNGVHVMLEIQPMRSDTSVSGLRLSLRTALPGWYFLHWLNSFSPGTSTAGPELVGSEVTIGAPAAGGGEDGGCPPATRSASCAGGGYPACRGRAVRGGCSRCTSGLPPDGTGCTVGLGCCANVTAGALTSAAPR